MHNKPPVSEFMDANFCVYGVGFDLFPQKGRVLMASQGGFNECTGYGIITDANTGAMPKTWDQFPHFIGELFAISAVKPDGAGGWYVGGGFTKVGTSDRVGFAHIDSGGNVLPLNPQLRPNMSINRIAVVKDIWVFGSKIALVGEFVTAAPLPARTNFAVFDRNTGVIDTTLIADTAWGGINSITSDGINLYISGLFNTVNLTPRQESAAIRISNGTLTPFDPLASICGTSFTCHIGGLRFHGPHLLAWTSNYQIAKINPALNAGRGGLVFGLSLSYNYGVPMAVIGNTIYTNMADPIPSIPARDILVGFDANTGASVSTGINLKCSNCNFNAFGSILYLSGVTDYNGVNYPNVIAMAIDTTTNTKTGWNPPNLGGGYSVFGSYMSLSGTQVFMGSGALGAGGSQQGKLASYDLKTQAFVNVPLTFDNSVFSVVAYGSKAYVTGNFTTVNGATRYGFAQIDLNTMTLDSQDFGMTSGMSAFPILIGSKLYILGGFSLTYGGETRTGFARFDLSQSPPVLDPFVITTDGAIQLLFESDNNLYVAGWFTQINGATRNKLAMIDKNTGVVSSWNPNPDNQINGITAYGNSIYIAGNFRNIGGGARNYLAAFSKGTNVLDSWNPNANGYVKGIKSVGSNIYVIGDFTQIGSTPINSLARLNPTTGAINPLNFSALYGGPNYRLTSFGRNVYAIGGGLDSNGHVRFIWQINDVTGDLRP